MPFVRMAVCLHGVHGLVCTVFLFWCPAWNVFGRDALGDYFEGLRERRLFSVAEGEALRRLSDPAVDALLHADLVAELAHTLVMHAGHRTGEEQVALLRQAQEIVDDFLRDHPDHPRLASVWLQHARGPATWGGMLAWQADLFTYDQGLRTQTLEALAEGTSRLKQVEEVLRRSNDTWADPLPVRERGRLREEASRLIAQALIHQATLLAPGTEQNAALSEAEQRLQQLEQRSQATRITWDLRLNRLKIARIRGDRSRLESLSRDLLLPAGVPAGVMQAALAELIRADLNEQDLTTAERRFREVRGRWGTAISPELSALEFEWLLMRYQTTDDPQAAAELRDQVEGLLANIGGPWGERSRILWQRADQLTNYGPELTAVLESARVSHATGNWQAAVDQFGRASELARRDRHVELALEAAFTRGSILLQHQEWSSAFDVFRRIVEDHPTETRAPEADLLACWCLGRLFQAEPIELRREAYAKALETHRQSFTSSPTVAEAAWMQGLLAESRSEWLAALELYREVPHDHPRGPTAELRIAHLHTQMLTRLREQGKDTAAAEDAALDELGRFLSRLPAPPAILSTQQAELVLLTVRQVLNHRDRGYEVAEELLTRVISSHEAARRESARREQALSPDWEPLLRSAVQLRVISLAGQGRAADAQRLLEELSPDDPESLLAILQGLSEMGEGLNIVQLRDLGRLQLQTARTIVRDRQRLSPAGQRTLDVCLAQALFATGALDEAVQAWQALVASEPRNRHWLEQLAKVHQSRQTRTGWEEAKQTWRRIEALSPPGSEDWLHARWHLAECCLQLGETDEGLRLIGVTRILYPELGNEALRSQFDDLETRFPVH